LGSDGWEEQLEGRPAARLAVDLDRTPVAADNALHGCEPEAAAYELRRKERLEQSGLCLGVHSGTGVRDSEETVTPRRQTFRELVLGEIRQISVDRPGRDRDRACLVAQRVRGIRDQVEDDLAKLGDVPLDRRGVR